MAARAVLAIGCGTWRSILGVATCNASRLYEGRLETQCDWSDTQRPPFAHHHYKFSKLMDWTLECFLLSDYPVGVKLCDWITFNIYYIVHVNNLFLRFHFKTINSICSEFITGVGHLWRSMTVPP